MSINLIEKTNTMLILQRLQELDEKNHKKAVIVGFLIVAILILMIIGTISTLVILSGSGKVAESAASEETTTSEISEKDQEKSDKSEEGKNEEKADEEESSDETEKLDESVAAKAKAIAENRTFEQTVSKDIDIPFEIREVSEQNQYRNTAVTAQEGKNGRKRVTYRARYDSSGNEFILETLKEEVVLSPVDKIIKIGTSDFNVNSDAISYYFVASVCNTADANVFTGLPCDDTPSERIAYGFRLGSAYYLYNIGIDSINAINITPAFSFTALGSSFIIGGESTYVEYRGRRTGLALSIDLCEEYGLACGAW